MNSNVSIAVRVDTPSPLVGEGSTTGQHELAWVRGSLRDVAVWREPLTRRRFATPTSPTRGEGKRPAMTSVFA
jgi:hypothetical protein